MSIDSGQTELQNGIKLFRNENYKEAIDHLRKIFETKGDIESGYHLALCYAQTQNYDKTLEVFDKIIKRLKNPLRIMQAHIIIGYIYAIREMYDLAEFELIEALNTEVENAQVHSALGYVYYKKGHSKNAITHLKKAVAINPNNANARNSLGFIIADMGGDIEEAIKEIKYALDIDSQNPAYLDSIGWAYFKKRDYSNAKRYLTRAFELSPDNKDIKEHLIKLDAIKK